MNSLVCGVELPASIEPAVHAPQPLAVGQPHTRAVERDIGALEPLDGLGEQVVGGLVGAEHCPGRRHDTQPPVGAAGSCSLLELPQGRRRGFVVTHVRCGLDQFEEAPAVEPEILVFAALTRGCQGLVVATETVEQDRREQLGQADQSAFALRGALRCGRMR